MTPEQHQIQILERRLEEAFNANYNSHQIVNEIVVPLYRLVDDNKRKYLNIIKQLLR